MTALFINYVFKSHPFLIALAGSSKAISNNNGAIRPPLVSDFITHGFSVLALNTSQLWFLEKEMATHSSVLAWRIPWTEEPGRWFWF